MDAGFLALKSRPQLLSKLERMADVKPTPSEIMEQRVSYVFGSMKESSGVTREQVRQVLLDQQGATGTGR